MQYLLGALMMAAFFICVYGGYMAGRRSRHPTAPKEVNEEQRNKAQRLRKDFEQLMSYDETKARGKKVT